MITTNEELIKEQTDKMLKIARQLDERGWAILTTWSNVREPPKEAINYNFIAAFHNIIRRNKPTNAVIIYLVPSASRSATGDRLFTFICTIPERVIYRSINAALELAQMESTRSGDRVKYFGRTKDRLLILTQTLDMPQHRKILCNPRGLRHVIPRGDN